MAKPKGGLGRGLDALFADLPVNVPPAEEIISGRRSEEDENAKKLDISMDPDAADEALRNLEDYEGSISADGFKGAADLSDGRAPSVQAAQAAATREGSSSGEAAESVIYIRLGDIKPNALQPRKNFDQAALEELASSIRELGVIQPVLVRKASRGYELVAGERRWRAARIAGLSSIPAIVRELDDRENAFYALVENMQREGLNGIEEAEGLKRMMDEFGLSHEEAGKVVGKSRSYVSNALRLLKLPGIVMDMVRDGRLSSGHARAIAGLGTEELQKEAAEKAVKEGWSVRAIESYTGAKSTRKPRNTKNRKMKAPDVLAAEQELSEALGTKVRINGTESRGKLELEYYSQDELERLMEILRG